MSTTTIANENNNNNNNKTNSNDNNGSNNGNRNMKHDCSNEKIDKKECLDMEDGEAASVLKIIDQ